MQSRLGEGTNNSPRGFWHYRGITLAPFRDTVLLGNAPPRLCLFPSAPLALDILNILIVDFGTTKTYGT